VDKAAIKSAIYEHPEFAAFIAGMNEHFARGASKAPPKTLRLKALAGRLPSQAGHRRTLAKGLLAHYAGQPLIDPTTSTST
jgi:type I restriction enzyme M protein